MYIYIYVHVYVSQSVSSPVLPQPSAKRPSFTRRTGAEDKPIVITGDTFI
jgi:hypothetical protein